MRVALLMATALAIVPVSNLGASQASERIIQPRPFGYFVGDVLTQKIAIDADITDYSAIVLPPADRIGLWFERRKPEITTSPDGQRWMTVTTQIINSPREPIVASIPALSINMPEREPLFIPAWPVSIAPLTPRPTPELNATPERIRPDIVVGEHSTELQQQRRNSWLVALGLTLVAWLAWLLWRNRRERKHQPFERAWHSLRKQTHPDHDPRAWQRIHQAINETAGRTIQLSELEVLMNAAPHLRAQREQIEKFFQVSNQRFFARQGSLNADETFDLLFLCRQLRRLEKQSAR